MPEMYLNAFSDQAPPRPDDGGAFALPQAPSRNGGPYHVNVITTIILFAANLPQLPQLLTDIPKKFANRLSGKFATNSCLNIPPQLEHVATLPCVI